MSDVANPPTAADLKAFAAARAAQDDAFRAELLANPRAAIEKLFRTELPPQITIQAVEEAPDTYVVVVPAKATAGADGELSDGDLEAVAGGSKAGAKKFFLNVGSGLGVGIGAPAVFGDQLSSFNDPVKPTKEAVNSLIKACEL